VVHFINRFTRSFYARRTQKGKKDSQLKQLFVLFLLLGSSGVKAARKPVGEIDSRSIFKELTQGKLSENASLYGKRMCNWKLELIQ